MPTVRTKGGAVKNLCVRLRLRELYGLHTLVVDAEGGHLHHSLRLRFEAFRVRSTTKIIAETCYTITKNAFYVRLYLIIKVIR